MTRCTKPIERWGAIVLLTGFCAFGVFDHSLWAPNDSREGGMVWDMFRSGNWTHLSLNGTPFLEKPPLLHWTALVLCSISGRIDAGLLRLPAALYGLGTLLIVFHWGCRLGRERAGLIGAFLCATSLLYAEYSRIVLTDVCLTFMVMLSLHCFWMAYTALRRRAAWFALFIGTTAFSFYAKGFIGPGFVITSVVAFLLLRHEWRLAIVLPAALAAALTAAILPWAFALHRAGGREFLIGVFIDNQLGRFFSLPANARATALPIVGPFLGFLADRPIPRDPYFVHKEPIYYYLAQLPATWLPWTLLVPPALWDAWRRAGAFSAPLASFVSGAFISMVVVLHASSTKVGCYALPLFPLLFFMVGIWSDDALSGAVAPITRRLFAATLVMVQAALFIVPAIGVILYVLPGGVLKQIAARIDSLGFNTESLGDPSAWVRSSGATLPWLRVGGCVVALLVAAWTVRRVRDSIRASDRAGGLLQVAAALVAVAMLALPAVMPICDRQRGYEQIAALVRAEIAAGRHVALAVPDSKDIGEFTFHADARLPEVDLISGVRDFLEQGRGPRGVVIHAEDAAAVRESLRGVDFEVRGVPDDAGYKSRSFRLVTRR